MAFNRSDIRTNVRDKLSAWPELVTTVTEDVDATETAIDLTAVSGISGQWLLECESEVMTVRSIASLVATVERGSRGTNAATHANATAIKAYPKWGWTDAHLNRAINKAIAWLGEGGVWTLVPRTNTFLSGYKEFGLPSGVSYPNGNHVKKLEVLQSDDSYKETLAWRHLGDRIIITSGALTDDIDVRMWIQQAQPQLSSDGTNLDADKYLEVIEMYVAGRMLEELVGNRTRYTDYSATLNDRASSLDELQRQAYFFSNQAVILRNEMSRPGLSGRASYHGD